MPTSSFDAKLWREFVASTGAKAQSLTNYYLGEKVGPEADLTVEDKSNKKLRELEQAVRELFSDAVEVGALRLPEGYVATDFTVTLKPSLGARFLGQSFYGKLLVHIEDLKTGNLKGGYIGQSRYFVLGQSTNILSQMSRLLQVIIE